MSPLAPAAQAAGSLRPARWAWLACGTAALLAGLVYLNALNNPFVYDDHRTTLENASLAQLSNLRAIFLHDASRPLVNLSYAVDRRLWGAGPLGFHVTNVLLHMLNVVLFLLVTWRFVEDRYREDEPTVFRIRVRSAALAAAVLFAVHPMMTAAVGYVSGRSEVLCATFFLLSVLSARRWLLGSGWKWGLLSEALWIAALLTKEIAAMLPFVLLCYDRLILDGGRAERRRRFFRVHVPLVTVAALAALLRGAVFVYLEHPGDVPVDWRSILDELDVIRRYFILMVVPRGQAIFHEVVPIQHWFDRPALTGLAGVGVLVGGAWWLRRAYALGTLGVLWFLVLLVPSSLLVVLGQGEGMAEHRVYLASLGLFLAAGGAIGGLTVRLHQATVPLRWVAYALFAVVVLSLGGRTMLRNAIWSSPVTLWREAAAMAPGSWLPNEVLGESLHEAGRHDEAIAAYRTAMRLRPKEELGYFKLGLCLAELGRLDEAASTFEQLRLINPQSTIVPTGLGIVAMISGDADGARRLFHETLEKDPRDVTALQWLALVEETMLANPAEALRLCEEIQRIAPGTIGNDECIQRNRPRPAPAGSGSR